MKKVILGLILIGQFAVLAMAQNTFRVGDQVEVFCNCFGRQEWVRGQVEEVKGESVKVRYGNGKYQFTGVSNSIESIRFPGQGELIAKANKLRNDFIKEADKYFVTVTQFAPIYNAKFLSGGSPVNQTQWQKAVNDLAELDALCKSKYAGVTNMPGTQDNDVNYQYAVWCEIANKRNELEKPARVSAAKKMIGLVNTLDNLQFAFNHEKNRVIEETQELIYDRAKWRAAQTLKYKPSFAEYGVEIPADFFVEVEKKADKLKTLIEQTAPNRDWEAPPFSDPAVETFIKAKFTAEYRGVKILKSGSGYKTWVERKSLSYVGSDSSFRYYKVEYNSYKRGWVLMKLPNRPYCQASEWIVGRGAKGMVVVSLGGSGIFMKCQ